MLVKCQMCQGTGEILCECSLKRDDADSRQLTVAGNDQELNPEFSCSLGESLLFEEESAEMLGTNNDVPCSKCGGSGMTKCLGCLGTGYVDMPCFA